MAGDPPASGDGETSLDLPLFHRPARSCVALDASLSSVAPLPSPSPVARSPCGLAAVPLVLCPEGFCVAAWRRGFPVRFSLPPFALGLGIYGKLSVLFSSSFTLIDLEKIRSQYAFLFYLPEKI